MSYITYTKLIKSLITPWSVMEMKQIQPVGKPLPEHFNHKKYVEKLEMDEPNKVLYQLVVDTRPIDFCQRSLI